LNAGIIIGKPDCLHTWCDLLLQPCHIYLFYCGSKSCPTSKLPIDPIQFLTQTQETTALIDNPLSFSGISFQKKGSSKIVRAAARRAREAELSSSALHFHTVVVCRLPIEFSWQERTLQSATRGIIWLVHLPPFRLLSQTLSTHPCHVDDTSYKPALTTTVPLKHVICPFITLVP
jgi:hypothetical protein